MSPITSVTPQQYERSDSPAGAVAIIASAGGIRALISLLRALPATFPLPIFLTQHLPRQGSLLAPLLSWHSPLNVSWAADGVQPLGGRVYLVPPGMCLAVTASGFELSPLAPCASSWLECGDSLITSLVALYGPHTIGIVLSGSLPAGVKGIRAINSCGGFTMAQNSISSGYFDMPAAAIDLGKAEIVMPPERMSLVLNIIAQEWNGLQNNEAGKAQKPTLGRNLSQRYREPIAETPLEQEQRHVTAYRRIVASQEALVAYMDKMGDDNGAAVACDLLKHFQRSLELAEDRLRRLSGSVKAS